MTACPTIPISRGAYYSGTKLPGCTIVFTGAGSYDTDSYFGINTLRWKWDFDYNGTFTIDVNTTSAYPTWTYSQAGTYTVAVQFIDDDGQCGAIYTFQITISGLKRLYYVKDHLGSIRVTVDSTGNIVSYDDYDRACPPIFLAEGMQLEGRSANYGSANEKYKFTGKERDVETGYDYFGARYYDSRIGRWLSVDPLTEKYPNISPYNYCANNPNSFVDPDGAIIVNTHSVQSSQYAQVQNMLSVIQTTTVGKQLYDYLNSIPQEIKISIGEVPPNKWNEGFGNIYVNDKSFEFTGVDITIDYSDLNVYGNKYIKPFGYDVFNTLIHELSHAKLAAECYSLWLALNDSEAGYAILETRANADMVKYIKETAKKKRNQQNNSNVKSETKNENDEFDDQESIGRTWDRSPGNIRYLHSQQYNGQ